MEEDEQSPEELQRDMRVQLMRNWVEDVKTAPDVLSKVQVRAATAPEIRSSVGVTDGLCIDSGRDPKNDGRGRIH